MSIHAPALPPAQKIDLPGRGRTWMYDSGMPPESDDAATLLLLHGWTSTAALNWYRCIPRLRDHYRVVALDHRGHGRGIRSRTPFRLEDCADDASVLLSQMAIDSAIAVGYSMGGPVAQLMWKRHRDVVSGVVLCATAAHFPTRRDWSPPASQLVLGTSIAMSYLPTLLRNRAMTIAARNWSTRNSAAAWAAEEWARHDPSALVQAGLALGAFDSRGWSGEIDVPVGVVITSDDEVVAPTRQWEMADAMPNAVAFSVKCDHRGCANASERFVPALLAACRAAEGKPDPGDEALAASAASQRRAAASALAAPTTASA